MKITAGTAGTTLGSATMKRISILAAILAIVSIGNTWADTNAIPAKAEKVKTLIDHLGDKTQLMGGAAVIVDPAQGWKAKAEGIVGVQGNVTTWRVKAEKLGLQTSVKPGIDYFYATESDRHLIGVGVCGQLTTLPPVVSETKESTGIVSKLPGNLEAVDWFVSVGSVADRVQPFVAGGLSLKW